MGHHDVGDIAFGMAHAEHQLGRAAAVLRGVVQDVARIARGDRGVAQRESAGADAVMRRVGVDAAMHEGDVPALTRQPAAQELELTGAGQVQEQDARPLRHGCGDRHDRGAVCQPVQPAASSGC